jgi:hypothetical protein
MQFTFSYQISGRRVSIFPSTPPFPELSSRYYYLSDIRIKMFYAWLQLFCVLNIQSSQSVVSVICMPSLLSKGCGCKCFVIHHSTLGLGLETPRNTAEQIKRKCCYDFCRANLSILTSNIEELLCVFTSNR